MVFTFLLTLCLWVLEWCAKYISCVDLGAYYYTIFYSVWSKVVRKQVKVVLVLSFLFSALMFCLVAQASLDDKSLVLYLSFDEGKGDTAKDSSKHGHDLSLIHI